MATRFNEGEPLEFGDSAIKELLTQTRREQERRALAYTAWSASFKKLLDDGDEAAFLEACATATNAFQLCNDKMKQLSKLLAKVNGGEIWSYSIDRLQQHEANKFQWVGLCVYMYMCVSVYVCVCVSNTCLVWIISY